MAKIYFSAVRGTLQWGPRYNQTVTWVGGMLETSNPAFIDAAKKHPAFDAIEGVAAPVPEGFFQELSREGYAPAGDDGVNLSYGLPESAGATDTNVYPTGKPPVKFVQCIKCGETMHPDEYPDHMKFHGRNKPVAKPKPTGKSKGAKRAAAKKVPVQGMEPPLADADDLEQPA